MDIERAIQFILENDAKLQAKLDAHVDTSQADIAQIKARSEADKARIDADIAQLKARSEADKARIDADIAQLKARSDADIAQLKARTDADIAQLKARTEQHNREMAEIREILRETTRIQQEQGRILVRIESNNDKLGVAQAELAAAQKATEATLKAFIDSLRRGGNGHSNGGSEN